MIESSDPLNAILAIIWSVILTGALALTWYAYLRWRLNPNDSLSHCIAEWFRRFQDRMLFGMMIGVLIGFAFGVFTGLFIGHWAWPVELK